MAGHQTAVQGSMDSATQIHRGSVNESMDGYEWGPEPPELWMPGSEEEYEANGQEF